MTVKYRLFFSWNFEKEERWLDTMSRAGLQLTAVAVVRYEFATDRTRRYRYRLEPPADAEGTEHDQVEAGPDLEYVCSSNGWSYYRTDVDPSEPEPDTDLEARIEQYGRLLAIFGIFTLNAVALLINSLSSLLDLYVVNLVMTVVLGLSCLAAVIGCAQTYRKVARLRREKRGRRGPAGTSDDQDRVEAQTRRASRTSSAPPWPP